jgi:transposase
MATPRLRRGRRLVELHRCLGLAVGGAPGARLAARLAIPASGDTLLRSVRTATVPAVAEPRVVGIVVGIDDWAWRRGHAYGTLAVDLERRRPIALLPDRQAETVAARLATHPSVEVVARDRAGAYAEGAREGAPRAQQIADRWHLLRKLGDAVRRVLDHHRRDLVAVHAAMQRANGAIIRSRVPSPSRSFPAAPAASIDPAALRAASPTHAARWARFEAVKTRRDRGWSQRRIAGELGLDRKTVRAWLRAGQPPLWHQPARGSRIAPFEPYLRRRWDGGCRNAAQLWREIRAQGFAGGSSIVRDHLAHWRTTDEPGTQSPPKVPHPSLVRPPWVRGTVWCIVADPDRLNARERRLVDALAERAPALGAAIAQARRFCRMVRQRDADDLDDWLDAARAGPLRGFASGIRRDLRAVRGALCQPWSTGPVEGQISRLRTLKRQMGGRAKIDLLRQRVLNAA